MESVASSKSPDAFSRQLQATSYPINELSYAALGAAAHQRRPSHLLAGANEIDAAINSPDGCYSQGEQRLHLGAISHEWTNQVERHASEIRQQTQHRNNQMPDHLELRVLMERNDADDATQHV